MQQGKGKHTSEKIQRYNWGQNSSKQTNKEKNFIIRQSKRCSIF